MVLYNTNKVIYRNLSKRLKVQCQTVMSSCFLLGAERSSQDCKICRWRSLLWQKLRASQRSSRYTVQITFSAEWLALWV